MSIIPVTVPPKKLAQSISSSATSFKLSDIKGWNGVNLTPSDFGTEAYAVFMDSTKTTIEIIKFDPATIASASITILARGLPYNGSDTPVPANQYAWAGNDTTVQLGTDAPQLFRDFLSEVNTATVTAVHTYNVLPESAVAPTTANQLVNKTYVDNKTGPAVSNPVNQVSHGFVVGDVIRISGINTYTKAQADTAANAEVIGIVSVVTDPDNFTYITEGLITTGVPAEAAGTVLFLSPTTAGALTSTEPTTIGHISMPLAVIAQSATRMVFHKYRGAQLSTIAGHPTASETVAGIVEEATQAQVDSKTDTGETGARLFVPPSKIKSGSQTYPTLYPFASVTPPQLVGRADDGRVFPVSGSEHTKVFGFVKETSTCPGIVQTHFTDGGQNGTFSHTCPAGNNRVVLVWTLYRAGSGASVTFNGVPLTQIFQFSGTGSGHGHAAFWGAFGDGGAITANVVISKGSYSSADENYAVTLSGAAQTSAIDTFVTNVAGNDPAACNFTPTVGYSRMFLSLYGSTTISFGDARLTVLATTQPGGLAWVDMLEDDLLRNYNSYGSGTYRSYAMFNVKPAPTTEDTVEVQTFGTVSGFTGLTPGATYYGSTLGTIAASGATNKTLPAGTAISATEILIPSYRPVPPRMKMGAFNTNGASGGLLSISGVGFKPRSILFFGAYGAASTYIRSEGGWSPEGGNYCTATSYNSTTITNSSTLCFNLPGQTAGYVTTVTEDGFNLAGITSISASVQWIAFG